MENSFILETVNVGMEQLPQAISEVVSDIKQVDEKIKSAINKANEAKILADDASSKKAGFALFGKDKKEAIEALQKSNISLANALVDAVDANKQLFENQKRMSDGLRCLFGLGVMNIAANRVVVRELVMKLQHASKEELSDLARQEIENVINQLRAQQDMLRKIDNIEDNIRDIRKEYDATRECVSKIKSEVESLNSSYLTTLKKVEALKVEIKQNTALQEDALRLLKADMNASVVAQLKKQEESLNGIITEVQKSLNEKLSLSLSTIETKVSQLEQFRDDELSRKSFVTSKIYNIITTLIAFIALALAILK